MKEYCVCVVIAALMWVFAPKDARSQEVAILPPSYEVLSTGAQSTEEADAILTMVKHAVKEAGMNVVKDELVDEALKSEGKTGAVDCSDIECLKKISASASADNAIAVKVIDKEAHFLLQITIAFGEGMEAKLFGNRTGLVEDIHGNVVKILENIKAAANNNVEPKGKDDSEPTVETQNQGLKPAVFWTSVGITGALAITYGFFDVILYSKTKDYQATSLELRSREEWNTMHRLQVADRILLAAALTGVVTSTVIGIFTNFKHNDDTAADEKTTAFSPVLLDNGGMLVLRGRF